MLEIMASPVRLCIAIHMRSNEGGVHLELVRDMITASLLPTFRRFVSRRVQGQCLTFKRATKELIEMWNVMRHPDVIEHSSNAGIVKVHFRAGTMVGRI